ncbi:MAG: DUF2061 domain-containing protein [Candidatus Aminicenantes bacterium]|nr:DUF2061 domain-containing protein [Candidatus Aminicenantes bacterium]
MTKKTTRLSGEAHSRTIAKAISWRAIATLTTMIIVFLFTRRIILTLGVGLAEVIAKITFYYLHERIWEKISWGKDKHPLSKLAVKRELEPEDMEIIKDKLKELGYID